MEGQVGVKRKTVFEKSMISWRRIYSIMIAVTFFRENCTSMSRLLIGQLSSLSFEIQCVIKNQEFCTLNVRSQPQESGYRVMGVSHIAQAYMLGYHGYIHPYALSTCNSKLLILQLLSLVV